MLKFLLIFTTLFVSLVSTAQICFQYSNVDTVGYFSADALVQGDFNHDGFKDFAIRGNQATILYGNGTNIFNTRYSFVLPHSPIMMSAADLNEDSLTDLIFGFDSVYVYISTGTGSFTKITFPSTGTIKSIAAADFDGDNHIDILAIIHNTTDSAAFFKGDGNGNLLLPQISSSVNSGGIIRVADLNNDNKLDAGIMISGGIQLIIGDGLGGFVPGQLIPCANVNSKDFTFGDLDGDHDIDLVVPTLYSGDSLLLYMNNGSGSFTNGSSFHSHCPGGVAIADMDNDGANDIVSTEICTGAYWNGYGYLEIHFGDGSGGFLQTKFYNGGGRPGSIIADDFTNDSVLDIVTANYSDTAFTMLIQSTGVTDVQISVVQPLCPLQWGSASAIATGTGPFVYSWYYNDTGQVNNNLSGSYHLMVTSANGCHLMDTLFIRQIPKISFRDSVYTTGCGSIPLADIFPTVTGGTLPYQYSWNTIPVQNSSGLSGIPTGQYILSIIDSNNCTASDTVTVPTISMFDSGTMYSLPSSPEFIATADFNEDSFPDLVTLNSNNMLYIFINDGFGGFLTPALINTSTTGGHTYQLKIGDFNNDNHSDIVIDIEWKIILFIGNGHGGFSSPIANTLSDVPVDFTITDYTNDGFLDLIAINSFEDIFLLENTHSNSFTVTNLVISSGSFGNIVSGDFNNDTYVDFIASYYVTGYEFLGNSSHTYSNHNGLSVYGNIFLEAFDLNNDGNLDLITQNTSSILNTRSAIYLGDGLGGFTQHNYRMYPVYVTSGLMTDMDKDGKPDFVLADNNFYLQNVDTGGKYSNLIAYPVGQNISDITTSDFDRDGNVDIAFSLPDSNKIVVFNNCITTNVQKLKRPELQVYPNPAKGIINIVGNFSRESLYELINVNGMNVSSSRLLNGQINITGIAAGLYLLKISDGGKHFCQRVIIQ